MAGGSAVARGIDNDSGARIITGAGNDRITGQATGPGSDNHGIRNNGLIDTGKGNDRVNGLIGGFSGSGSTVMGKGKDTLTGFGTGNFDGGGGNKDKIELGTGTYSIDRAAGTITSGGDTMNIQRFERIGGTRGRSFALRTGTLDVNGAGVASFF